MLTEHQKARLKELQAHDGFLNSSEEVELEDLLQTVEDQEAVYLRPATERLRVEREAINVESARLTHLLSRRERLERRLIRFVALASAERAAISSELARIASPSGTGRSQGR